MAQAQQWFARINGKAIGPLDMERLKSFVESNHIDRDTDVSNGSGHWVKAGDVPELFPDRRQKAVVRERAPSVPPADDDRMPPPRRVTVAPSHQWKSTSSAANSIVSGIISTVAVGLGLFVTVIMTDQYGGFGFIATMAAFGVLILLAIASQIGRIVSDVRAIRDAVQHER